MFLVSSPIGADNLILGEGSIDYPISKSNSSLEDMLEGFISSIYDWAKSVAADEGHVEIGAIVVVIMALPSLINTLVSICPFINDNGNCDTILLLGDVTFIGLGFMITVLPIFGYHTVANSVT